MQNKWYQKHAELLFWIAAMVWLAFADPTSHHFTMCPLSLLGFDYCPGCGLGHSISWLFRGEITHSFESHPLGTFAIFVILYRIYTLSIKIIKPQILSTTNHQHE